LHHTQKRKTIQLQEANISKLHCQRALSFDRPKVAPPVKGVYWMKIVNKTSFEHFVPPGVISAFYEE